MQTRLKVLYGIVMTISLGCGFLDPIWPDAPLSFKRLHIFGFNLLSGGSLILYHTLARQCLTPLIRAYFALALAYAICAAASWYVPTLLVSVPLFGLVESVRVRRFRFLPLDFFDRAVPVSEKFNHASLLCLSIGIAMASLVILNNEFHRVVTMEKLTLEVFFLGFSFPVSLITMSVMFSFLKHRRGGIVSILHEISFWVVNGGVVIFFGFILFGLTSLEIAAATMLFVMVTVIFILFLRTAPATQQKNFLVSGMVFLLFTALTGIFYILAYLHPALERWHDYLLEFHAVVSLYGWNLSGLMVIMRWTDFPLRLNSALAILLHWIIVVALAPAGKFVPVLGAAAVVFYVGLLLIVFFGTAKARKATES